MWVRKTKTGKYCFTERFRTPQSVCKTVSVTYDRNTPQSRKMAQRALDERIRQMTDNAGDYTLGEVVDAYLAEQRVTVKESTYRTGVAVMGKIAGMLGRDIKAEALTAGYIRQRLLACDPTHEARNNHITRIKSLIKWAYANDMVSSPAAADKLMRFKTDSHRVKIQDKFMDSTELRKVLDAMDDDCFRLVTEFLALSGLRIGEALALTVDDIDDEIHVTKTYNHGSQCTSSTKTSASTRNVHIQPELKRNIKALSALMLERKLLTGHTDCDLFLVNTRGKHLLYMTYRMYLEDVTERVIGRRLSPHSLRHTHASLLFEKSLPLDVISRRLGHEDSSITREIYTHVTENLRQKDADLIDSAHILC